MYKLMRAMVPVLVVLSIALVITVRSCAPGHGYAIRDDVDTATRLAGLVAAAAPEVPLAKDGAIDVFRLVRQSTDDPESWVALTRSLRFDRGPTRDQIESGDYSGFPYGRWRGTVPDETVPVVWDRKADSHGMRVVGFSDGTADLLDAAEWEVIRPQ